MPQSKMDEWSHRLGYEHKCTFAQVTSFLFKGCPRGLPDEVFTREFGIPVGPATVPAVVLKQALKSDMTFPRDEDGNEVEPSSFISEKAVCLNPACQYYWMHMHPDHKVCPECKKETKIIEWFSCDTNYAGIHKTDGQTFTSVGKLGSQIVKRVHSKPMKIKDKDGKTKAINPESTKSFAMD